MINPYKKIAEQATRQAMKAPDQTTAALALVATALAILEVKHGLDNAVSLITIAIHEALEGQQHGKT